jgi:parallel beta-helix repeat protein
VTLRTARFGLPLAAATIGIVLAAPSAQAAVLHCGDVVTRSTRLDNDLVGCPGPNALVISGAGVALNLNGHELTGSGAGTGVLVDAASTGAKVSNGQVSGFSTGVGIEGASATVSSVVADHNTGSGVSTGAYGSAVKNSVLDHNGVGVLVDGGADQPSPSADVIVQANVITGSAREGIGIYSTRNARLIRNTVVRNGQGIRCAGATASLVDRNAVTDNLGTGIGGRDCSNSTFTSNEMLRNATAGFAMSDGPYDVIGNTASANGADGFSYYDNYGDQALTRFGSNRATDNGGWGFSLMLGTTDLGGNVARRNALGGFTYVT